MANEPVGSGFSLRRNVNNFNDVNYNFQVLWRIMAGHIGTPNLLDSAITQDKIAALAVGSAQIDNAVITTAHIQNLAVTNGKISDLSASKITAGTITATIEMTSATITGGVIRTATSGARLEMTSAGLSAYNSSNNPVIQILASQITSGIQFYAAGEACGSIYGLLGFGSNKQLTIFAPDNVLLSSAYGVVSVNGSVGGVSLVVENDIDVYGKYKISGASGVYGSFEDVNGLTVTVSGGIITSIS